MKNQKHNKLIYPPSCVFSDAVFSEMIKDYIRSLKDDNSYYILSDEFLNDKFRVKVIGSIQEQDIVALCQSSIISDEIKALILNDMYQKLLQRDDERKYPKLLLRKKRKMNQNKEGV